MYFIFIKMDSYNFKNNNPIYPTNAAINSFQPNIIDIITKQVTNNLLQVFNNSSNNIINDNNLNVPTINNINNTPSKKVGFSIGQKKHNKVKKIPQLISKIIHFHLYKKGKKI